MQYKVANDKIKIRTNIYETLFAIRAAIIIQQLIVIIKKKEKQLTILQ